MEIFPRVDSRIEFHITLPERSVVVIELQVEADPLPQNPGVYPERAERQFCPINRDLVLLIPMCRQENRLGREL